MDCDCRFHRFRFMATHRRVLLGAERYCICLAMRDPITTSRWPSMSTQTLGSFLSWTQVIAFYALCVVLPFRFVLHTGRFKRGVLLVWISSVVFSFCSVLLGEYLRLNIDKSLADSCCEGPQFLCLALMGWTQGMIVSGIAFFLYWRRKRLAKKQESVDHEAAS